MNKNTHLPEISSGIENGIADTCTSCGIAGESIALMISLHVALASVANHISNILLQHLNELAGKLDSILSRRPVCIPSKAPMIFQ